MRCCQYLVGVVAVTDEIHHRIYGLVDLLRQSLSSGLKIGQLGKNASNFSLVFTSQILNFDLLEVSPLDHCPKVGRFIEWGIDAGH